MNPLYNVNTGDIANRGLQAMGQASQTAASFDKERTTLGAPKKTVGGGVMAAGGGAALASSMGAGAAIGTGATVGVGSAVGSGALSGAWAGAPGLIAGAVGAGLLYYLS